MLEKAKPDIVSVCTWHPLHPAPTIAAAQAGVKAVICEKPMATSLGAANSMVDACEASGTKLIISHQRRFTPGWEKARELIQQKVIGDPVWVNCKIVQGLLNCGTHAIDGSRFVLGDPQTLWVMGAVERGNRSLRKGYADRRQLHGVGADGRWTAALYTVGPVHGGCSSGRLSHPRHGGYAGCQRSRGQAV